MSEVQVFSGFDFIEEWEKAPPDADSYYDSVRFVRKVPDRVRLSVRLADGGTVEFIGDASVEWRFRKEF